MWKVKLKLFLPSSLLLANTCSVLVLLTLQLAQWHTPAAFSFLFQTQWLLSLWGLKLKVPLVTSVYSGSLLKTVFNGFWHSEYIFSRSKFCTLFPGELAAKEPGFKSLNDLSVLNNSWAWSGSQRNWRQLSVIPRFHPSIWGTLWVAALPTVYTRLWAWPLPWQVTSSIFSQLNMHMKFDLMLYLSEDLHTVYHAKGGGLKFCTFADLGCLQHTIGVRVLWSLGSTDSCLNHSLQRNFSLSRAQGFCVPCFWQESHKVLYAYQY